MIYTNYIRYALTAMSYTEVKTGYWMKPIAFHCFCYHEENAELTNWFHSGLDTILLMESKTVDKSISVDDMIVTLKSFECYSKHDTNYPSSSFELTGHASKNEGYTNIVRNLKNVKEERTQYMDHLSEETKLEVVKANPYAIQFIDNPSEAVKLAAVLAIKYIQNPSEAVKLAAVKENGLVIQYIKNPSEAVQLTAVNQNGLVIQYIKNPSEELQLAAVNNHGYAIFHIKGPSEEVQLAAVQQDGNAIAYIKNPSEAIQLAAVKQTTQALRFITNPSEAVKLAALTFLSKKSPSLRWGDELLL